MLKKAAITWNAKQVVKMMRNNGIKFDNAVQRGYEWDKKRASLLISSLISGYPVPPFFAAKGDDGKYDMLDGKQRMTSIRKFYDGEFALVDIPPVTIEVGGTEMELDINGYKYEDLDVDVKDELDSASLTIYYFDGITDDEVNEMFYRLNSGKPINQITMTRVKAKSKDIIKELGQHELFQMALTKKALESYANEDIVIKAAYMLDGADNLETKNVRQWVSETEIEKPFALDLTCVFERIKVAAEKIEKEDKKIAKKILSKTHLLSLVPIIQQSRTDKVKDEDLKNWLMSFYGTTDKTTVSNAYNESCTSGSMKKEQVVIRNNELKKSYDKMLKKLEKAE